jgi:hypothetical protein
MVAVPTAVGVPLGTALADDYGYSSCDDSSCSSTWNYATPSGDWDSIAMTCDSSGCESY